jgi:D-beta-D-heptose 7-phosphate kinase/D-beta-D-heptose 1-phosphate adenosyltransferase
MRLSPKIVERFASSRLLVVGDVMLDRYWVGEAMRISPEAPVPVVRVKKQNELPGGAANVARNAAALGAAVELVGQVGSDAEGTTLQVLLEKEGVRCAFTRIEGALTTTKLRVTAQNQQLIRIDFEGSSPIGVEVESHDGDRVDHSAVQRSRDLMWDCFRSGLSGAAWIILSDYDKGAVRDTQVFIRAAREAGVPVIVDPKGRDFERYRGAFLLKPNLAEFEAVAGVCWSDDVLVERGEWWREHLDLEALLITRGKKGMTLIQRKVKPQHYTASTHDVYDVTGAGDTVIAVMGVALSAGSNLAEAATLANLAAGIVVTRLGAATVKQAELVAHLELRQPETSPSGVVSQGELASLAATAKARGERLVMTNGCFDLLHPGHVHFLERAKALGDRLIVAVNDDDSVRRLKGPGRPINPLNVRMQMLCALRSVDWVVPFAEDSPQKLYSTILPAVLVKGSDYANRTIAGAQEVQAAGGELSLIELKEGFSTTALVTQLQNKMGSCAHPV